jgi:hypothetical protein
MWLLDRDLLSPTQRAQLEQHVLPLGSLQELVRWGFALQPPSDVADVIVQDEFCHDVVMRWLEQRWLVFDTT